jgi:hypothetical protein
MTFGLPAGRKDGEGRSDEHPFELQGIRREAFESLLRVMYNPSVVQINIAFRKIHAPGYRGPLCLTRKEWIEILGLSTMWEFLSIRELAIRELSKFEMKAADKIRLGREYDVIDWLLSGYREFVQQPATLSLEDAERIGFETAFRLLRVREKFLIDANESKRQCCACSPPVSSRCEDQLSGLMGARVRHDLNGGIRTEFARELTEAGGCDVQ